MNVLILFESKVLTLNIMRCLADAGAQCHVIGAGSAKEVRLSKYCRDYVKCEGKAVLEHSQELVEQVDQYCSRKRISCIIPGDYQTTLFLSRASSRIRTPTIPLANPETLRMLANKWTFAQLLKTHNLPTPKTFLVENMQQYEAIDLPFPRVVKPLEGGGRWTAGRDTPGSYVKQNLEEYKSCAAQWGFPLLIQEFIPGIDVGLNIFAVNGSLKVWTMQEFVGDDRLKFFRSEEMLRLGKRLVELTRFQGVANIDMRIDSRDGQFKFIECNPRFWGSLRASRWNGVNFPAVALHYTMGLDIKEKFNPLDVEYVFPSKVLLRLFKRDIKALKGLPEATRKDLLQIISDPLSCLYSVLQRN